MTVHRARHARRRALFLIAQRGMSQAQAAPAVGVHRQTVNIRRMRYREQGKDGALDGRRVSPRRDRVLLTADETRQVRGWIADRTPDQLKLPFVLWTSRAVRELIEQRFAKRLGRSTVQLHLQRRGMTPPKPLAGAQERRSGRWSTSGRSKTARRAKSERAARRSGGATRPASRPQPSCVRRRMIRQQSWRG
jgi:transposase